MKKLIFLLYLGAFVCAKPSYPIHPGVGAIYQGPNAETIIRGPDGSVITAEATGGAVAVDGHNVIGEVVAVPALALASVPATSIAQSAVSHQYIEHSAAAAAASSATVSLSQTPIVVQDAAVVAQPIFVAKGTDTTLLDGPSGSIRRHGEDAIISGPASTTIREGNVIASIPVAEVNSFVVEPARTLVAPQVAVVDSSLVAAPVVGSHGTIVTSQLTNVAEANAHLADINLINEANYAAQVSAANEQNLAAEINAANAASLANEINSQAAIAEANRVALINANAINSAKFSQSQEAIARANFEAQAIAQANLDAQLAHIAAPQIALADVNAANAAATAAYSQEAFAARAGLEAHLVQSVTPQLAIADVNAINSAAIAHSQEAIARANLEAERNAIANQIASHNLVAGLNPIITQGNQLISEADISGTAAPVVQVTPLSPIVSTTGRPIIIPPRANTIVSSTIAPTQGYVVQSSPVQNVIVSSTLKPVSGIIRNRVPVISHPTAIVGPVATLGGEQVLYQSSSSSSSQAESHSSSSFQSSSLNVVNGGVGGVAGVLGAPIIGTPVGIASTDYAQWQDSFSNRGHSAGESVLASKYHRGIIH